MIKKAVILILILSIIFIMTACGPEPTQSPQVEPFTEDAGRAVFVLHQDFALPIALSEAVDMQGYTVESLDPDSGLIVLSKPRTEGEFTKAYAVWNVSGEAVVPFSEDVNLDKVFLLIDGGIIVTHDNNYQYNIYSLSGGAVLSGIECEGADFIGGDYFRVNYESGRSQIYNVNGQGIFTIAGAYPASTSDFYACGAGYLLVETAAGGHYICNSIGAAVQTYYDSDSVEYRVFYLENSRFIIIKNEYVSSFSDCEVVVTEVSEDKYINQTVYIYNASTGIETEKDYPYIIYGFANSYYYAGLSDQINSGYNYMTAYNVLSDKTLDSTYPYTAYILDSELTPMIRISDGVFIFLNFKGETATEQNGLKARLIGLNGSILWDSQDTINIATGYNNGMLVVGKTINSSLKYGAYNAEGTLTVEYEYDALSVFCGGYAIGSIDGSYYRISKDGTREEISSDIKAFNSLYGFYIAEENGYKVLYNTAGDCLLNASQYIVDLTVYTNYENKAYIIIKNAVGNVLLYQVAF